MDRLTEAWLEALERRHLADLTMSEVARALRALSSCYVERRSKLAEGGALSSAGQARGVRALLWPAASARHARDCRRRCHLRQIRSPTSSISGAEPVPPAPPGPSRLGVAARFAASIVIRGRSRKRAGPTGSFSCDGRVVQASIAAHGMLQKRSAAEARPGTASSRRTPSTSSRPTASLHCCSLARRLMRREPAFWSSSRLPGGSSPWWRDWQTAIERAGGRADEWRFPADLPPTQLALARAAGLDPRELTARSLFF